MGEAKHHSAGEGETKEPPESNELEREKRRKLRVVGRCGEWEKMRSLTS